MSDHQRSPIETIIAPYGREIRLDDLVYDSGMRLMRITIREGMRYTILEIDAQTARRWGAALAAWAEGAGDIPPASPTATGDAP